MIHVWCPLDSWPCALTSPHLVAETKQDKPWACSLPSEREISLLVIEEVVVE